jgi:hypothetical protein
MEATRRGEGVDRPPHSSPVRQATAMPQSCGASSSDVRETARPARMMLNQGAAGQGIATIPVHLVLGLGLWLTFRDSGRHRSSRPTIKPAGRPSAAMARGSLR